MKRIVFYQQYLACGGTESALFDLINLLDKNKYDISVFIVRQGDEWEQKFRDAGIKVLTAWSGIADKNTLLSKIITKLQLKDIECQRKSRKKIWKYALKGKYDLSVNYLLKPEWNTMPIRPKGAKVISYIHGDCLADDGIKKIVSTRLSDFKKSDKVICVSQKSKESFVEYTGCSDNVCVCYNPLNSDRIKEMAKENIEIPFDGNYICAIGRLSPEKGFVRLIKIFSELVAEGISENLVIVGEGPDREGIEAAIEKYNVKDRVFLAGYQSNPYPYIKNSNFVVCSSFTEGLPVIAMEALALEKPIVASFPSIEELFAGEQCGIITDTDDDSLKNGLRKMFFDLEFYNCACDAAKKRSKYFTGEKMVKQVEKIFDEVMDS